MSEPTCVLQIRLPAELKAAIESLSARAGMSQNKIVQAALTEYLRRQKREESR